MSHDNTENMRDFKKCNVASHDITLHYILNDHTYQWNKTKILRGCTRSQTQLGQFFKFIFNEFTKKYCSI